MSNPLAPSNLLTPLISSAAMRAIVDDRARLQRMLDVEVALARAQAAIGIIPALATDRIAEAAQAERYDLARLGEDAASDGDIARALVDALTAEIARTDPEATRFVHLGVSSQDIIDTALMLELRAAIDALTIDLNRAIDAFIALAGRHRRTAAVARTALRHALPMPLGLRLAGYAAALARARERLKRLRKEALVLQFGGIAGTLATLGERGLQVSERFAALIDLPLPEAPWHGHSDRVAEVAAALAILTGTCGKIARDIALLMQTEVAEAFEPAQTRTGWPAAPHKRSPTAAAIALGAATIAPNLLATVIAGQVQEHERALGGWQAQAQAMPALLLVTSGALNAVANIAQGLEIDAERMRDNLEITRGLIMAEAVVIALTAKLTKEAAEIIVEEASRKAIAEKRHLNTVLAEDARVTQQMTPGELARLFELMSYQGVGQAFIERLVGSLQPRGTKRP
ncbi:MAG: 3-carboxy-cis,cis-muconate cycloisomerase [Alphaproteobacteria bacterium]|jgi:3-carboxy-cis,cis-muconate cycloisomerase|nr:3-carboxy-cis,cis-muconate cycloisomerase [Alphaproteobacteria bacterium]